MLVDTVSYDLSASDGIVSSQRRRVGLVGKFTLQFRVCFVCIFEDFSLLDAR